MSARFTSYLFASDEAKTSLVSASCQGDEPASSPALGGVSSQISLSHSYR